MKTVTLVRHATAIDKAQESADIERSLTKEGGKEAQAVAAALKAEAIVPDLIFCSPAIRAFETARKMAKVLDYPKKQIVVVDALYESLAPPLVLEVLKAVKDDYQSILLVGHDPVLSEFVRYFAKDFTVDLPKGSALALGVNRRKWQNLGENDGKLYAFVTAEKPAPGRSKKQIKDELSGAIRQKLGEAIDAAGLERNGRVEKLLKSASKELTEKLAKTIHKMPKQEIAAVVQKTAPASAK